MKIRITEILSDTETLLVSFHSSAGSGKAAWVGVTPKTGDEMDVEFNLDETFAWGKNLTPSTGKSPNISQINGVTRITAELIQITNEDCAELQFGDSVLLVELDGPTAQKSGCVDLRAIRVLLYPTNT